MHKHFPLSFHANARPAAEAAEFARKHGKFWDMHALIFENYSKLSMENLKAMARQIGLDDKALEASIKSEAFKAVIDKDFEDGRKAEVNGTPTAFINGRRVPRRDFETIKGMIDEALNAGTGQRASH